MSERDGGPAFPTVMDVTIDGSSVVTAKAVDGMSLRDYFAGQIIAGLCSSGDPVVINGIPFSHEKAAYILADAMLKERAK